MQFLYLVLDVRTAVLKFLRIISERLIQTELSSFQVQDVENEREEAEKLMNELMAYAATFKREKVNAKELIIGMKCGGSDGLSGITANPTVGLFSDMLVSKGGTTILTEVPEMFGAETILMNRCANKELFEKTVHLINDFKEYFIKNGQEIYENPSPGNKDGGITTLEDKSLGCTQKSGSSLVKGVLAYAEPVNTKGLNLLSAPGNDLVAATACAASGAQMVLLQLDVEHHLHHRFLQLRLQLIQDLREIRATGLTSMQEELLQMIFHLKMQLRNFSSLY